MIAIIESSDPTVKAVVPHGGLKPFITPNPIAAGLPTSGDPLLIDVSTSITSMGFAFQQHAAGRQAPGRMADRSPRQCDARCAATLSTEPKGALLPLGGIDAGHKGFALGLLIEAMTGGLAGTRPRRSARGLGRHRVRAGARSRGVRRARRVQAANGFSGGGCARARRCEPARNRSAFRASVDSSAIANKMANGVALYPKIMPTLEPWAERLGVTLPSAL